MTYVAYFFMVAFGLTVMAAWLYMTLEIGRSGKLAAAVMVFIVGPMAVLFIVLPWQIYDYHQSPDLATLKKDEWACIASRTEPALVGKVIVNKVVCDAYGRM